MNTITFKLSDEIRDRLLAHKRHDESENQAARRLMMLGMDFIEANGIDDSPTIEDETLGNGLEEYTLPHDYMAAKTISPQANNWDEIKRQTELYSGS